MKKLNKKQKEKVKEIFFKGLHVISYILSVLFILSMVIFGIQSCHKPKSVSAEGYEPTNQYYKLNDIYGGVEVFNEDPLFDPLWYSCYPNGQRAVGDEDEKIFIYDVPLNAIVDGVEATYKGYSISWYSYQRIQYTQTQWYFYLESFDLIDINNQYHSVYWRDDLWYEISGGVSLIHCNYDMKNFYIKVSLYDVPSYKPLEVLLTDCDESSFTFNKAFNYNAPLNTTIEGVYGAPYVAWSGGSTSIKYIDYDIGTFISNGEVYNRIRYVCTSSDGTFGLMARSTSTTSLNIVDLPSGYWIYTDIQYANTHTNKYVSVNTHDTAPFDNNGAVSRYYLNSSTWSIDSYRYIEILPTLSQANQDVLERFNNNNQNYYNGNVVSGDINNIFTLIAGAFSSWVPILSVYLLPGITVGTLIFIPLVAILVFAIIRIIKK